MFSTNAYNVANIFWLLNRIQYNRKRYNSRGIQCTLLARCTKNHTHSISHPENSYSYSLIQFSLCRYMRPPVFVYLSLLLRSSRHTFDVVVVAVAHFETIFRLIKFQSTEFASPHTCTVEEIVEMDTQSLLSFP